jgi:hypothetical protein
MSIAIKQIYTRPSVDIPFWAPSSEYKEYQNKNYVETGHVLFQQTTYSDDKLSQINFIVFANRESRILFLSDERCKEEVEERIEYNQLNNILTRRIFMLD